MHLFVQPPPRGCVLKHLINNLIMNALHAAASARLCVETFYFFLNFKLLQAAASARLCVETVYRSHLGIDRHAAASARLCVETC